MVPGSNPGGPTKFGNRVYVYILRSFQTGRFYVGSTEDLENRLKQHNGQLPGLGRSTLAHRPWEIIFSASYPLRSQAMAAERHIKKMKSKLWINKLLEGAYRLPEF